MDSGRLIFDASIHGNMLLIGSDDPVFRGHRSVFNMEETSRKRPFFSSADEYMEEEIYDEQFMPEKKRRLTADQVHMLEKSFEAENKLEPERKSELAKKLGLQPRQVAVWFQNRRARWKTKQLERDYDLLKSSYDSLLSDYHNLVKDNDKLKCEMVSLTEKVHGKEVVVAGIGDYQGRPEPAGNGNVKAEDRHSSGSSVVVDEEGPQQLVDSGDSYFPDDEEYRRCMGVQSEGEEGGDNVFVQQGEVEGEQLGWWVWS